MIVNAQTLRGIYIAFNTLFNKAFEGQKPTYQRITTVVPPTTEAETYAWLGDIPGMREWIDDWEIQNLSDSDYTIKNTVTKLLFQFRIQAILHEFGNGFPEETLDVLHAADVTVLQ